MKVALSAFAERLRGSLFVVPMVFVVAGIVLAEVGIAVDGAITDEGGTVPLGLASTVASARAVLSTVAGATITVAGIAFSVSILVIELASSQYSPRVVSGLFRDPFNKRVIGISVGTFAYCLVVMRSVHSSIDNQGPPVIPNVSVAAGVVLGIVAVMAIIAFINHNAHAIDISEILAVATRQAIHAVTHPWSTGGFERSAVQQPDVVPPGTGFTAHFDRDGWIQLLDHHALLEATPDGATVRFETAVGRYALNGSPLCTIWPEPPDVEAVERDVRGAVRIGETRTLQQDSSYGVRQLVDVALKALSPGINDPTTAQDAIFHVGAVLRESFACDPPARDLKLGTRRLVLPEVDGYAELTSLAYDEIRRAAAQQPTVCLYLVESISQVVASLEPQRRHIAEPLLRAHARLVVDACESTDLPRHDVEPVRAKYDKRFFGPV
jgi:uncharacterized membrane protein